MTTETMSHKEFFFSFLEKIINQRIEESSDKTLSVARVSDSEEEELKSKFKYKIGVNLKNEDNLNLFVKVTEVSGKWDESKVKPFEKERLFYTSLMKTYKQLEDKHGLSDRDRLRLPTFYGAEAAHGNEILVLEDLTSRGFGTVNRFESLSWPYAAAAITELAKFHALSIAFQHENPTEFENFTAQLHGGLFEKDTSSQVMTTTFITLALKYTRNENKNKLMDFLNNKDFLDSANDLVKSSNGKVILHGQFWHKNMMHKTSTDGSIEVIPLDFSTIQVGNIVTDFIYFVFTATDASFRAKYYGDLFVHYCLELARATAAFGLNLGDIYSGKFLMAELTEKLPYGLYSAVTYLSVMALDSREDRVRGLPVDEEPYQAAALQLYIQRLNEVVDACVDAGILKEQQQQQQSESSKRCGIC